MPKRIILAAILIAAATSPVNAQPTRGGVRTETQERLAGQQGTMDLIWNLIGLVGLLGLLGLARAHPDDSYHPASLE